MITGSLPNVAMARMRARGNAPTSRTWRSDAISTAPAPSAIPLELPAVWTWRICLALG